MEAYFDNAATTKPFPEIADILHDTMLSVYANPSALHKKGMQARKLNRRKRT
jgi:cysteine desulfurase